MTSVEAVRRREIVLVGPTPPPHHGVAVATEHLARELEALGCLAGHLDTRDPRSLTTIGRFDVANVIGGVRDAASLARLLKRSRGATVLLPLSQGRWGFLRDAVFIAVARVRGAPVIVQLHGSALQTFYRSSGAAMRWLIRGALRHTDQAWVLSDGLRQVFEDLVPLDRVEVVQNVCDDVSVERSAVDHPLRVLYLSNLLPEKGAPLLLEALERLGSQVAGWHIRLVGSSFGGSGERLEAAGERLHARGARVELTGVLTDEDKRSELAWADVFVFPPVAPEGQPMVLLEAMSAGLPIVTTRQGAIPETVRDGREGIVCEPTPAAVADALRRLDRDPELRRRLGAAGRTRWQEAYRPERLRRDLARLLTPAASSRRLAVVSHTIVARADGGWRVKNRVGELLEELIALGWAVTLITRESGDEEFVTHQLDPRVEVLALPPGGTAVKARFAATARRAMRRADARLVFLPSVFSALFGLGARRPSLVYAGAAWSLRRDDRRRLRSALEAAVARRAGRVLSSGRAVADRFGAIRGVLAEVTVPMVNPEVPERICGGAAAAAPHDPPRLLFVGSVAPAKGVAELAGALEQLPGVPCRVVGPLVDTAEGRRLRARLEALEGVELCGYADWPALRGAYEWADVLVLPSHSEGLPRVIHEATAFGVALVLTPVGGIPQLLEDERDALLVPVGDTAALTDALRTLIDEPERIRRLNDAARATLAPLFADHSAARQITRLLRDA